MKIIIKDIVFECSETELALFQSNNYSIPLKEVVLPELISHIVKYTIDRNGDKISIGDTVIIDPGDFGETNVQQIKLDSRIIGESAEVINILTATKEGQIVNIKLNNKKYNKASVAVYSSWIVKKK